MKPIIACSLIVGCMFISLRVNAQAPVFNKVWEKMCGSEGFEQTDGFKFMQTDDSGYIYICTRTGSGIPSGTKYDPSCYLYDSVATNDIWMFKLDSNGNQIWDRAIGGLKSDYFGSLINDVNGDFLLIGASNSNPSCEKTQSAYNNKLDGWIVKINKDSAVIWDKRLGSKEVDLFGFGAVATDGSIIATGYTESSYPNNDISDSTNGWDDIMVFKLDSNGNKVWNYQYGSFGHEFVSDIIALSNEQYLVIGYTDGTNNGDVTEPSLSFPLTGKFREDNWVIKIDSAGNKIWDRRYGCLTADDYSGPSLFDSNGDVVIGGSLGFTNFPQNMYPCNDGVADTVARGAWDAWIYKIDTANGNIKNEKRFGGDFNDDICQIVEMTDKGYLLACKSNSNAGFEKSENRVANVDPNNYDFWIVRMDSVFNIIWDKTIGGSWGEQCPNVIALSDSTFIIAGQTGYGISGDIGVATIDTTSGWPRGDIWVAKWYIANPLQMQELSLASFNLYPNPAQDVVYVTLQNAKKTEYNFTVQNMTGESIVNQKVIYNNNQTIVVPTASWPPGVYVINIEGVTRKLVKL